MSDTYTTRAFHALAHDFRVVAESREVGEYFEELLAAFPEVDGNVREYRIRVEGEADAPGRRFVVELDDDLVVSEESVGTLGGTFVHALNRRAISTDYAVTCHAGGVELDGVGFVFPAHMESGKTTLTAGLVRAGFSYLTDEAVAFDASSRMIEPYPKPLSIDHGSHFLFPELEPAPAPGDDAAPEQQWQVPPDAIRPGAVGRPCPARYILFPTYREDATTELEELSAATTLVELATNTFEFRDHPRHALEVLAGVVEGARGFRLVVGDLDEACRLIAELAERSEFADARGSRGG
jgi:hypothetical protein